MKILNKTKMCKKYLCSAWQHGARFLFSVGPALYQNYSRLNSIVYTSTLNADKQIINFTCFFFLCQPTNLYANLIPKCKRNVCQLLSNAFITFRRDDGEKWWKRWKCCSENFKRFSLKSLTQIFFFQTFKCFWIKM